MSFGKTTTYDYVAHRRRKGFNLKLYDVFENFLNGIVKGFFSTENNNCFKI